MKTKAARILDYKLARRIQADRNGKFGAGIPGAKGRFGGARKSQPAPARAAAAPPLGLAVERG